MIQFSKTIIPFLKKFNNVRFLSSLLSFYKTTFSSFFTFLSFPFSHTHTFIIFTEVKNAASTRSLLFYAEWNLIKDEWEVNFDIYPQQKDIFMHDIVASSLNIFLPVARLYGNICKIEKGFRFVLVYSGSINQYFNVVVPFNSSFFLVASLPGFGFDCLDICGCNTVLS